MSRGRRRFQQRSRCFSCNEIVHVSRYCTNKNQNSQANMAAATSSNQQESNEEITCAYLTLIATDGECKDDWVIDSGASRHMCCDKRFFKNMVNSSVKTILAANKQRLVVEGEGEVNFDVKHKNGVTKIRLLRALYVPNLHCNLLSVFCLSVLINRTVK